MNKCICGYSYEGLRDRAYYKTGVDKGKVKEEIKTKHLNSATHNSRMNKFRKPFDKVIVQLNYLLNGIENELIFDEIRRHILICKNIKKYNSKRK